MRTREKRRAVRLSAQIRSDDGQAAVNIHDVSGRGMMLSRPDAAPPPGSYLELRRGPVAVIARIVWRNGRRFGVRTQDAIDVQRLTAPSPAATIEPDAAGDATIRHHAVRADAGERSRMLGRLFQYVALLAVVGVGAVALAGSVTKVLAPLHDIQAKLIAE